MKRVMNQSRSTAGGEGKRSSQIWKRFVFLLSCAVVVGTVGALTLPAITMSKKECPLEEHTHKPDCYKEVQVLGCAESLGIHEHTEDCYDGEENLICRYADFVLHEHDDFCYDEGGGLLCQLPEIKEHTHDEACYEPGEPKTLDEGHTHGDECYEWSEDTELICEDESEEHTHGGECYELTRIQGERVCGEEEREPVTEPGEDVLTCEEPEHTAHIHEGECFVEDEETGEKTLVCEKIEKRVHQHGPECFTTEKVLICGKEEHRHDETCIPASEPETTETKPGETTETKPGETTETKPGETTETKPGETTETKPGETTETKPSETTETKPGETTETKPGETTETKPEETTEATEAVEPEVEAVVKQIGELPDPEKVVEEMTALQEGEDEDALNAYYMDLQAKVNGVYAQYKALTEEQQAKVTNVDKLMNFSWLFVADMGLDEDKLEGPDLNGEMPIDFYVYAENINTWVRVARQNAGTTKGTNPNAMERDYITLDDLQKIFGDFGFRAGDIKTAAEGKDYTPYLAYRIWRGDDGGWWNTTAVQQVTESDKSVDVFPLGTRSQDDATGTGNQQGYAIAYIPGLDMRLTGASGDIENRKVLTDKIKQSATMKVCAQEIKEGDSTRYVDQNGTVIDRVVRGDGFEGKNYYICSPAMPRTQEKPATNHVITDRPVNEGIRMHLFNYGSAIDTYIDPKTENYGLDFYYGCSYGYELMDKDAEYPGHKGGYQATNLEKTMALGSYPKGLYNNRKVDLSYLFDPNYSGLATMSYGDNQAKKDRYQATGTGSPDIWNQTGSTGYARYEVPIVNDGGLFKKDEKGFLVYDSAENAATYNSVKQGFDVYDYAVRPKYYQGETPAQRGNFLPFNAAGFIDKDSQLGNSYKLLERTDCWFGMTMEFDFYMPENGEINGSEMRFDFSGDDDVWVYLDDVLVLDIGGCHGAQSGGINFKTGHFYSTGGQPNADDPIVSPNCKDSYLKTLFENVGKDVSEGFNGNTFAPYTKHTLRFFYMERGGNISYCRLRFNMPVLPYRELTVKKDLTVTGDATQEDVNYYSQNESYMFQLVDKDKNVLDGFKNLSFNIMENDAATEKTVTTDDNGCFELKAGQSIKITDIAKYIKPEDFAKNQGYLYIRELIPTDSQVKYGPVTIKTVENAVENTETKNKEDEIVPIGDKTYYSYELQVDLNSDIKSRFANYRNTIVVEKMGYLAVRKQLSTVNEDAGNTEFSFQIRVNNNLIPDGTTFTVKDADNSEEEVKSADGIIKIKAGQTAYMDSRLHKDDTYYVTEIDPPENWTPVGYKTAQITKGDSDLEAPSGWTGSGTAGTETDYDPGTGGTIQEKQVSLVTVTNKYTPFYVDIPVDKTFSGALDDTTHTASFEMIEVNADGTVITGAVSKSITITCTGSEAKTEYFRVDYDSSTDNGKYYYKITENPGQDSSASSETIFMDPSEYIVEVTVSTDSGAREAKITKVTKDGTEVTDKPVRYVNIVNAVKLPETGGAGTTLYTFSGLALMCAAALVYNETRKRRKGAR